MKMVSILIFAILLSSCATPNIAAPNFHNGKYYMAGDDNCRFFRQLDADRIMCFNSSSKEIGYRAAMTDQQLQMYMHEQSIGQADDAMLLQYWLHRK